VSAKSKKRVGRGKIDASRFKGGGVLGLTNKDKLALAKSGAKDLMEGTMEANRKRLRKQQSRKGR